MKSNEFIIFLVTYLITFPIMLFIDKKAKFSDFFKDKFKIDNKSKATVFSVVASIFIVVILALIFYRLESYVKPISAGVTLGIVNSLTAGIQSTFIRKQSM